MCKEQPPDTSPVYPGTTATVAEIVQLAEAYSDAASALFENARNCGLLSYAPARLCSIHAIELYLNAYLRDGGSAPEQVRARLHNLADNGFVKALCLRKKTAEHLVAMTEKREYLVTRYAPELASQMTEITRLTATLREVRSKTTRYLAARADAGHTCHGPAPAITN